VSHPETLKKKYAGKASKAAVDLMSKMLDMDPTKRITAYGALSHEYFDDVREKDIFKNLPREFSPPPDTSKAVSATNTIVSANKKTTTLSFSSGPQ